MRVLLVSDLHYTLPQLDWIVDTAAQFDVVVIAGDSLDITSSVPLEAQIVVVQKYLCALAARTMTVACSGNHDLDVRNEAGEKATRWLQSVRSAGVHVDGDSFVVGETLFTACAWWEGPHSLGRLQAQLVEAAHHEHRSWVWVYHSPPEGPLSWTGRRHFGDPELPQLLDRFAPDIVLCGHIHESPFTEDGSWVQRLGGTWLFNAGRQRGDVPAHVELDLDRNTAAWKSVATFDRIELAAGATPGSAQR